MRNARETYIKLGDYLYLESRTLGERLVFYEVQVIGIKPDWDTRLIVDIRSIMLLTPGTEERRGAYVLSSVDSPLRLENISIHSLCTEEEMREKMDIQVPTPPEETEIKAESPAELPG